MTPLTPNFAPPEFALRRLVLERLQIASTVALGSELLASVDVGTVMNYAADQLVAHLTAYLTACERCYGTEQVPFTTTVNYDHQEEVPRSWWQEHKPRWWARLFRRKTRTIHFLGNQRVTGSVEMTRKVYDAFPESSIMWPESLGRSMVVEVFQQS